MISIEAESKDIRELENAIFSNLDEYDDEVSETIDEEPVLQHAAWRYRRRRYKPTKNNRRRRKSHGLFYYWNIPS
ncbi:hypothetical protein ACTXT7_016922, partial [Hymenolepis weldensis]